MTRKSDSELKPRNGSCLEGLLVARISGCQRQKEVSLDDQLDNGKQAVGDLFTGEVKYRVIATKGKGESLDRPELEEIEAAYRSGLYDIVVFDDLSRLVRGYDAVRLLGIGVDNRTRTICVNDGIDTAEDTWETDALAACGENVRHNEATSRRVKQKCMNRFKKDGSTARRPIMGYIVPEGATSYDHWRRDANLEPYIHEGARILRSTLNGEAVAAYFNANNVPVGPLCRRKQWDGTLVLAFYRNTLLKGRPRRGVMATVKQHATGKRRSKKNPKGPTYYHAPNLAFFSEAEFDELVALLAQRNKNTGRKVVNGVDPRAGVPRKRTRSFGQHARCWYCGHHYVWGANGIKDGLMCSAARERGCWNSVGFPGPLAAKKLVQAVTEILFELDGFDDQFRAMVDQAKTGGANGFAARRRKLESDESELRRERNNVMQLIRSVESSSVLAEMLKDIEHRERLLAGERRHLETAQGRTLNVPNSTDELRLLLLQEFERSAIDSLEFGDLIRLIVAEMHVYLVRLCDGGQLESRAKIRLNLLGIFPDHILVPELLSLATREITLDLFDPPQRERIRKECVALAAQGLEQRAIAAQLSERPTQTAVWKALQLQRRMDELTLSDPYILVTEPPKDYSKLRRHKHPQYKFTPLAGYQRPEL